MISAMISGLAVVLAAATLALALACRGLWRENRGLQQALETARQRPMTTPPPATAPIPAVSPVREPGIDMALGLKMTGGKPRLFHKFLGDFLEKYRDFPARTRQYLESGNYAELELLAHTLKGNAAMLGFRELSAASALLETGARELAPIACQETLNHVQRAFGPAFAAIKEAISGVVPGTSPQGGAAKTANPENLAHLLAEARDFLDRGEFGAHLALAAIQSDYDLSRCQAQFDLVRRAVENGDYDDACRDLQALIDAGSIR